MSSNRWTRLVVFNNLLNTNPCSTNRWTRLIVFNDLMNTNPCSTNCWTRTRVQRFVEHDQSCSTKFHAGKQLWGNGLNKEVKNKIIASLARPLNMVSNMEEISHDWISKKIGETVKPNFTLFRRARGNPTWSCSDNSISSDRSNKMSRTFPSRSTLY